MTPRDQDWNDTPVPDRGATAREAAPTPRPGATAAAGASAGTGTDADTKADKTKITVTRVAAARSAAVTKSVTRRVVAASRADGASESGLTRLIWNQVLSFGADAMITVALAGTVFFSAAQSDQKGNILYYLLVTMAPFALLAPVIGPVLDRFQHGRRWAMATSGFGRAILAVLMAQHFNDLFILFPLALGSLVLSKAYSVVRAAAAPRVVPRSMTLVTANARLSMFGIAAAMVGGGFVAIVVRVTGSYPLGLWVTAIAFAVTGYFALLLPKEVDSASPAQRHPEEPPRPREQRPVPPIARIKEWVGRGFDRHVITSIQSTSLLRWAQGFLTMFLAFYVERTSHGLDAALRLGAVAVAAGAGGFLGTAAGARLKLGRPDVVVICCTAASAVACVVAALMFSLPLGVACMAVCSAGNSLGKLSLDAVIQRDVDETLRSSAFARSETFLQLAWVVGAAVALLLPANKGRLDMSVAAVFLGVATIVLVVRSRSMAAATARTQRAGNSARDSSVAPAGSGQALREEASTHGVPRNAAAPRDDVLPNNAAPRDESSRNEAFRDEVLPGERDGGRDAESYGYADGARHLDTFRYPEPGQPGSTVPGPGTV